MFCLTWSSASGNVDGQENLGHEVLRALRRLPHLNERRIDLVVGNRHARRQTLLHQFLPSQVGLHLRDQRRPRDAVVVQHLVDLIDRDVVLLRDALEVLVQIVLRDLDVEFLRFLQLQQSRRPTGAEFAGATGVRASAPCAPEVTITSLMR